MSWFKKKKTPYPNYFPYISQARESYFDHRLQLDCGCILVYSQKTKQVLKDVVGCSSEEEHRAEIKEDVTKEKWDNIVEMYRTFSGRQEVFGSKSSSGNWFGGMMP